MAEAVETQRQPLKSIKITLFIHVREWNKTFFSHLHRRQDAKDDARQVRQPVAAAVEAQRQPQSCNSNVVFLWYDLSEESASFTHLHRRQSVEDNAGEVRQPVAEAIEAQRQPRGALWRHLARQCRNLRLV